MPGQFEGGVGNEGCKEVRRRTRLYHRGPSPKPASCARAGPLLCLLATTFQLVALGPSPSLKEWYGLAWAQEDPDVGGGGFIQARRRVTAFFSFNIL